jgi:hypothetical protein
MRKCAVYRAIAIVHARQAADSRSDEICEMHVRMAASFLALANNEAMRGDVAAAVVAWNFLPSSDFKASGHLREELVHE